MCYHPSGKSTWIPVATATRQHIIRRGFDDFFVFSPKKSVTFKGGLSDSLGVGGLGFFFEIYFWGWYLLDVSPPLPLTVTFLDDIIFLGSGIPIKPSFATVTWS